MTPVPRRVLPAALIVLLSLATALQISSSSIAARPTSLDRLLHVLFQQPRWQIDERIVADPYVPEHYRIRWIAPDRLRTDIYGTNLHVGKVGCSGGRYWICGLDGAPHLSEVRRVVMAALFPTRPGEGYCCLRRIRVARGVTPHSYIINALGGPWLCPLTALGCPEPGIHRPAAVSPHYRAVLDLDANGRPIALTSTLTLEPPVKGAPPRIVQAQEVSIMYSGNWGLSIPRGARVRCPSWDRTPGSWCVRAP